MKVIENKLTTIPKGGSEDTFVDYVELIKMVVLAPSKEGTSTTKLLAIHRVMEAIKDVENEINLEDQDFVYIQNALTSYAWPFYHPDVVPFINIFKK